MKEQDTPLIRRTERFGGEAREAEPVCPVCGRACEWHYENEAGEVLGCERCVTRRDAWKECAREICRKYW